MPAREHAMGKRLSSSRLGCAVFALALGLTAAPDAAFAATDLVAALKPDRVFAQVGTGDDDTRMYIAGVTYDWSWRRPLWNGVVTGYWEGSFGRWTSDLPNGMRSSAWITQLGLTPVLRWSMSESPSTWFAEAGIGANVLLPVYRSSDKSFSTAFNFGDHLAVGRTFGEAGRHELALRVQHFSNAGIKHPNPGENFVQLRYSLRYGP
jgi:lipid A 3-O-deacylase